MTFLVDEDVPTSAISVLERAGHNVHRVAEVLLRGSDDRLVAAWAAQRGAIIVTCNARHFRALLSRPALKAVGLVILPQLGAAARLAQYLDQISLVAGRQERVWFEVRETTVHIKG